MAVPVFGSAGGIVGGNGIVTLTPGLPGSIAAGDYLIAFIQVHNTGGKTFSVSAGWTIRDTGNSNNQSGAWADRIADAATDAAPIFTWTGSATAHAKCYRVSGVAGAPLGNIAKVEAVAVSVTPASITSSADNSLVARLYLSGNPAQTPTVALGWTQNSGFQDAGGGDSFQSAPLYKSGSVADTFPVSATQGSSTDWKAFTIEIKGTGSAPAGSPLVRATQVEQQALLSYSTGATPTNVRATQVSQQALFSYTTPTTKVRATQVAIQVLRSVAAAPSTIRFDGRGNLRVNTTQVHQVSVRFSGAGGLSAFGIRIGTAEPVADDVWPASLPQCPILTAWDERPQPNTVDFTPEVGPVKLRRKTSQKYWLSNATFKMTNAQLVTFKTFYEDTLEDGTLSFTWAHPITKIEYDWNFLTGNQPKITRMAPNASTVQFRLVRR